MLETIRAFAMAAADAAEYAERSPRAASHWAAALARSDAEAAKRAAGEAVTVTEDAHLCQILEFCRERAAAALAAADLAVGAEVSRHAAQARVASVRATNAALRAYEAVDGCDTPDPVLAELQLLDSCERAALRCAKRATTACAEARGGSHRSAAGPASNAALLASLAEMHADRIEAMVRKMPGGEL